MKHDEAQIGLPIAASAGLFAAATPMPRSIIRVALFIRDELFRRRIIYLKKRGYPILTLRDALDTLAADRLPPCTTVITMDDG